MDPRTTTFMNRPDVRSELMKRKGASMTGVVVNMCPFGCTEKQIDDHGYCRHLVGFTNDKATYEPMLRVEGGRRRVQVPMVIDREESAGMEQGEQILKPDLPKCQKGDQFVQISTSWRVYRDVVAVKVEASKKAG